MDIIEKLQRVYDIAYTLALNVKEAPECFHDGFDIDIISDCENIMDILNEVFKYYKV